LTSHFQDNGHDVISRRIIAAVWSAHTAFD